MCSVCIGEASRRASPGTALAPVFSFREEYRRLPRGILYIRYATLRAQNTRIDSEVQKNSCYLAAGAGMSQLLLVVP